MNTEPTREGVAATAPVWTMFGESLDEFVYRTRDEPADSPVIIGGMAPVRNPETGLYGPPALAMQRLREEWLLRTAFPHRIEGMVA